MNNRHHQPPGIQVPEQAHQRRHPLFGAAEGVTTTVKVMENTMNPKSFAIHKHKNDNRIGISPHILKCTRYNGERYQMGKCRIELQEIH